MLPKSDFDFSDKFEELMILDNDSSILQVLSDKFGLEKGMSNFDIIDNLATVLDKDEIDRIIVDVATGKINGKENIPIPVVEDNVFDNINPDNVDLINEFDNINPKNSRDSRRRAAIDRINKNK